MNKIRDNKFILILFLVALIVRVAVALTVHCWVSNELQEKIIPPDARGYETAMDIVDTWKSRTGIVYRGMPLGTYSAYNYYMAAILYFTGYNRIIIPIINSILGALLVFFIYDLAQKLFNKKTAYISTLLYAFFPSLVFWSSQNLKDTPCLFAVVASSWGAVKLLERFRASHLAIMVFVFALLIELNALRNYIYIFLIYSIIFYFIFNITRPNRLKSSIYAITFFIFLSITPQYGRAGILSQIPASIHRFIWTRVFFFNIQDIGTLSEINELRRGGSRGNAALERVDISSFEKVLRYLPKALTYFLFMPFPWDCHGLMQKATIPENILWYTIFPFILYGLYVYRARWKAHFILSFFVLITLIPYSLIQGNFGTAYRHKAVMLPFFFIFAGAGIANIILLHKKGDR